MKKKFFKAITFRGYYEWLPTVIFFWYSFFFLVLVQRYGPFAVVDNWFTVNFSRPGFALFNFVESWLLLPGQQGLINPSYATPLRPFLLVFSLVIVGVFLFNLAIIWFLHWTRAKKRIPGNDPSPHP